MGSSGTPSFPNGSGPSRSTSDRSAGSATCSSPGVATTCSRRSRPESTATGPLSRPPPVRPVNVTDRRVQPHPREVLGGDHDDR